MCVYLDSDILIDVPCEKISYKSADVLDIHVPDHVSLLVSGFDVSMTARHTTLYLFHRKEASSDATPRCISPLYPYGGGVEVNL